MKDTNQETQEDQFAAWSPDNFGFAPDESEMLLIQKRVAARLKSKSLYEAIHKNLENTEGVPEEAIQSSILLSMYINTAFEIGKEAAFNDVDKLMQKTVAAQEQQASNL